MNEIGGFFELELNGGEEYHSDALKLNSGRNALWYSLKVINPQSIHIPYYTCNAILEPIRKMNIKIKFYSINEKFEPMLPSNFNTNNDYLLYINYFGINNHTVAKLSKMINNLITDNSQAFYSMPIKFPSFYSPRKFFGISDGGYLYTSNILEDDLQQCISYDTSSHLIKKIDLGINETYNEYKKVERIFSNQQIMLMSKLTQRILSSIDYKKIKRIREHNFLYIHEKLKDINELRVNTRKLNGPMKYPLLIYQKEIKQFLIDNKIFISTYWPGVIERVEKGSIEYNLTKYLLPIPIDQRYNLDDMKIIIRKIKERLK